MYLSAFGNNVMRFTYSSSGELVVSIPFSQLWISFYSSSQTASVPTCNLCLDAIHNCSANKTLSCICRKPNEVVPHCLLAPVFHNPSLKARDIRKINHFIEYILDTPTNSGILSQWSQQVELLIPFEGVFIYLQMEIISEVKGENWKKKVISYNSRHDLRGQFLCASGIRTF